VRSGKGERAASSEPLVTRNVSSEAKAKKRKKKRTSTGSGVVLRRHEDGEVEASTAIGFTARNEQRPSRSGGEEKMESRSGVSPASTSQMRNERGWRVKHE
jgi:hypothetical protein